MQAGNAGRSRDPGVTWTESIVVRALARRDLDAVVRIDSRHAGRTRREYYERKIAEATRESGICVSLVGECDGCVAGFLLARLYYGEFGLPEPTAIVDSIGVDPGYHGRHVGAALMRQLKTNLRAIGIESVQTQVEWSHAALLGFLAAEGFRPIPTLTLEKRLTEPEP
jgi:ribosomal protein S18 acetylase RimI-like enzyme